MAKTKKKRKPSRQLVQLEVDTYLYKYAVKTKLYRVNHFWFPYNFTLPVHTNYNRPKEYFKRIAKSEHKRTMLVSMHKPTPARLFAFIRWLDNQFVQTLHNILMAVRFQEKEEKSAIVLYLEGFNITEYEYNLERALKSWQRKKRELRDNGQEHIIDFDWNGLRPTRKRERRGNMQTPDLSDL